MVAVTRRPLTLDSSRSAWAGVTPCTGSSTNRAPISLRGCGLSWTSVIENAAPVDLPREVKTALTFGGDFGADGAPPPPAWLARVEKTRNRGLPRSVCGAPPSEAQEPDGF